MSSSSNIFFSFFFDDCDDYKFENIIIIIIGFFIRREMFRSRNFQNGGKRKEKFRVFWNARTHARTHTQHTNERQPRVPT